MKTATRIKRYDIIDKALTDFVSSHTKDVQGMGYAYCTGYLTSLLRQAILDVSNQHYEDVVKQLKDQTIKQLTTLSK